jgi:hypothetical protein
MPVEKQLHLNGKGWLIVFFFCVWGYSVKAQGWLVDENTFLTNWNASVQIGTSALLNEVYSNFSGAEEQMNNYPDFAINIQIAKMVYERFDLGIDLGLMHFNGNKNNTSTIEFLNQDPRYFGTGRQFLPYPVHYKSRVSTFLIFSKYNYINFSSFTKGFINLNLYVKAGLGLSVISGELGYIDHGYYIYSRLKHPLYAINRYDMMDYIPKPLISAGMGVNYQVNHRIFLSAEFSFQTIFSTVIDIVPNYKDGLLRNMTYEEAGQYRQTGISFTGKFMVGATYFFNFDIYRRKHMRYLPFYHNRYRSYYSKFQTSEKKRISKARLPFFTDKLKIEITK